MKKLLLTAALAVIGLSGAQAAVVAQWTFETSIPTTAGPLLAEVGVGTANSNTGGTFSNPAGWGSAESWSSNGWGTGEYFEFQVSTVGLSGITVNWQQVGSSTGPANFSLQYSTDGVSFATFANYAVNLSTWNGTVTPAADAYLYDLSSITTLNNDASIYFRLTMANTTSIGGATVAATGTGRIDNFTVNAIPEPSTYALIGMGLLGLVVLRRMKTSSKA